MVTGFLCGPRIYKYEGWVFEMHAWCGPWPHKQDGEPRKRAGRKFWGMIKRFEAEPNRELFRVGGGCCSL